VWDGNVFTNYLLSGIETTPNLRSLRERFFLLKFLSFDHLFSGTLSWPIEVIRDSFRNCIEVTHLAMLTFLWSSSVDVSWSFNNSTVFVFVVLFNVDTVSHVLVRTSVEALLNTFGRFELEIVALFVTIWFIASPESLFVNLMALVRVANRCVGWLFE